MNGVRCAKSLTILLIGFSLLAPGAAAEELPAGPRGGARVLSPSQPMPLRRGFRFDWSARAKEFLLSQMEFPRHARVTRSFQPLRQIRLVGGDRFVAECLDWQAQTATFRLLDGQVIRVPVIAVAELSNPTGEASLMDQSFEAEPLPPTRLDSAGNPLNGETRKTEPNPERPLEHSAQQIAVAKPPEAMLDDTMAADGRRSLRIDASTPDYRAEFPVPLTDARIEFSFQTQAVERSTLCGEWRLEIEGNENQIPPVIVRVDGERGISASYAAAGADATFQTLSVGDGWHNFIALVNQDRIRLIVDDALLASFAAPKAAIRAIRFAHSTSGSKNRLWIDELQVHKLLTVVDSGLAFNVPNDSDLIRLVTGDELFGRLIGFNRTQVDFEVLNRPHTFSWDRVSGLAWRQPSQPVQQSASSTSGLVAKVEMQPFVDRPDCPPECWTITIAGTNSEKLLAQHTIIGGLELRWSQIFRITPLFYGRSILLDARRFHLGNSIRSDFNRHLPDGAECRCAVRLQEIPSGKPYLSLEVAEMEAASPKAPPASPFLRELRAGHLVTDVFVNEHRIGDLNSLIRFKAAAQNPERLRIAFDRRFLRTGMNSIRLRQKPLKESGREFDDCEVGNFHLEFDMSD